MILKVKHILWCLDAYFVYWALLVKLNDKKLIFITPVFISIYQELILSLVLCDRSVERIGLILPTLTRIPFTDA